jgi:hypothetical protein
LGVEATRRAEVEWYATCRCACVVVTVGERERLCAQAKSWGSCDGSGERDCAVVSQGKECAVSRPQPSERTRERIEKIERGASKGTHAEQKTTTRWGRVSYASVKMHKRASQKSLEGFVMLGGRARVPRPKMKRRQLASSALIINTMCVSTGITTCLSFADPCRNVSHL